MTIREDPYSEYARQPPTLVLCNVEHYDGRPVPNYSSPVYAFPPIESVRLGGRAKYREEGIKKSKPAASRIEVAGFESAEVSFEITLTTEDPRPGTDPEVFADIGWAPYDYYKVLAGLFKTLDTSGRNQLFALAYPLTDPMGVEIVFFESFEAEDVPGEETIIVRVTLKEVTENQAIADWGTGESGSGGGGGSSSGGGGGKNNRTPSGPGSKATPREDFSAPGFWDYVRGGLNSSRMGAAGLSDNATTTTPTTTGS